MKTFILCKVLQIHNWMGYTRPYTSRPGEREYRLGRKCTRCGKDIDLGDM